MGICGIFESMKESVRIDCQIVERLRKYVKSTGQTISGCIGIALSEYLDEKEGEKTLSDYVRNMSGRIKESNKKKK